MLNINKITGVSALEIENPVIEEKQVLKYNGDCFADVNYKLVLTPIQSQLNNLSFFTPVISFCIKKENEKLLFRLTAAICFQLKDFHIFPDMGDLEDCIYEVYNQILLKIQKEYPKHIKESPFKIPTSEEIYPHLLRCIQMVYPDFVPKQ
jgi:hypothetical protein